MSRKSTGGHHLSSSAAGQVESGRAGLRPVPGPAPSSAPGPGVAAAPPTRPLNRKKIFGIAVGILLALGMAVGAFLYYESFFVGSEDAEIASYVSSLAPQVGGRVTGVFVDVDQPVTRGQLLVRIDPRDYRVALDARKGQLASARAQLVNARTDFKRKIVLLRHGAVTQAMLDNARATFENLKGAVRSLEAQRDQAALNLRYCELRAPLDGRIAQRNVQPGMVVSPGQPVLNFVQSALPWVIANFKETELSRIRPGQRAEIFVDAVGKGFPARVESFSPATGAEFAVIPPQNATGNFIKIVQRIPVKLVFDPRAARGYESRLVAGSSVEVKVYVK